MPLASATYWFLPGGRRREPPLDPACYCPKPVGTDRIAAKVSPGEWEASLPGTHAARVGPQTTPQFHIQLTLGHLPASVGVPYAETLPNV